MAILNGGSDPSGDGPMTGRRPVGSLGSPEQFADERTEARAPHRPGAELVNIFIGERYITQKLFARSPQITVCHVLGI